MLKFIKRILYFLSFFLFFFVVKEFIAFYVYLDTINPILAIVVLVLIGIASIYYILIPIIKILSIPINPSPVTNPGHEMRLIEKRINSFKNNPYLLEKKVEVKKETKEKPAVDKKQETKDK